MLSWPWSTLPSSGARLVVAKWICALEHALTAGWREWPAFTCAGARKPKGILYRLFQVTRK